MTREERLELLKQIEKDIYVCSLESTFLDDAKSCAIHSAIEELEHEPCEDCISRQDLREPRFIIAENDYQKGWNDALDSVYENAPSVQKTGHWIDTGSGQMCSRCSEIQYGYDNFRQFCASCGAKMERSDKE